MESEEWMEVDDQDDVDMVSVSETTGSIRPYIPPIVVPVTEPVVELPSSYHGIRFLTSEYDNHLYGIPPPRCTHARTVWLQAGLPMSAVSRVIEVKLMDWAIVYAHIEMEGDSSQEVRSVRYQTSTDCLYFCSWRVLLRWLFCACQQTVGL